MDLVWYCGEFVGLERDATLLFSFFFFFFFFFFLHYENTTVQIY